ncbi:MAG: UbiA family prenyltransferase [Rhodothermales bacterium]|nr:UbiA family prenyltransferase [Rhodothermales bacterium]
METQAASLPSAGLAPARPLVVDLDGTLLTTDTLWESCLLLLRRRPLDLLRFPAWLRHGKAHFKRRIAERVVPEPDALPYNQEVLTFVQQAQAAGRPVVLATAADRRVAEPIAEHLGGFAHVVASDGATNVRGAAKLAAVQAIPAAAAGFDYIGDAPADQVLWEAAEGGYLVAPTLRLERRARERAHIEGVFAGTRSSAVSTWARALRLHQWVKNLLIGVPLLVGHRFGEVDLLLAVLLAFVAFGLCASGVYVLNDLVDLEADRRHARKRWRPFAQGSLPIQHGVAAIPLLVLSGLGLAFGLLPATFGGILLLYLAITTAYSFYLKRVLLVDVVVLAGLYAIRLFAGGVVAGIALSPWLLAFSIFIFFSLALMKRYAELVLMQRERTAEARGRGYRADDGDLLRSLGTASGLVAVLVLALYINSDQVVSMYSRPELLWLVGPPLLYWISRMWMVAHRGGMHDDPIVYTIKDRVSYLVGGTIVLVIALSI